MIFCKLLNQQATEAIVSSAISVYYKDIFTYCIAHCIQYYISSLKAKTNNIHLCPEIRMKPCSSLEILSTDNNKVLFQGFKKCKSHPFCSSFLKLVMVKQCENTCMRVKNSSCGAKEYFSHHTSRCFSHRALHVSVLPHTVSTM